MARLISLGLSLCLIASIASAQAVELVYEAYVEGLNVGVARIQIASDNGEYWIRGKAKTSGLVGSLTGWRSFFRAHGILDTSGPKVLSYRRTDAGRGNELDVLYASGEITRYSNKGEQRGSFTPPAPVDLLSTVFMLPHCERIRKLHDGKDLWRLDASPENGDSITDVADAFELCQLAVVDEDDATSTLSLWIGEIGEMAVPLRLQFRGDLNGVLELVR